MLFVPVVSNTGKPLMPCHPARARELVRNGKALRRFNRGIFYIRLKHRSDGEVQPICVGIDPGSKQEGLTVKSEAHTFINIQAEAVTWVKEAMQTRRDLRSFRRGRKAPYRPCRQNRAANSKPGKLAPSTKARWQWKLRLVKWLSALYPITVVVVEDIAARAKTRNDRWNGTFGPLQIGKAWFYKELSKIGRVEKLSGFETKALRDKHGLGKRTKGAEQFDVHCVDSWCLANYFVGGHTKPDNKRVLLVTPLRFHRRQLHKMNFAAGGVRYTYGGTRSGGFKRGSIVKHSKVGIAYVGGFNKSRGVGLRSLETGENFKNRCKPEDIQFLAYNSWRTHLLPLGTKSAAFVDPKESGAVDAQKPKRHTKNGLVPRHLRKKPKELKTFICQGCEEPFVPEDQAPSHLAKNPPKFCSHKCQGKVVPPPKKTKKNA